MHKVPFDVNAEHKPFLSLSISCLMDKYASKLTDFLIVDCIIFVSFWFYLISKKSEWKTNTSILRPFFAFFLLTSGTKGAHLKAHVIDQNRHISANTTALESSLAGMCAYRFDFAF
ncbi:MAG: hypothetical protein ACTSWX_07475 [Promethearchaeota archaeon]